MQCAVQTCCTALPTAEGVRRTHCSVQGFGMCSVGPAALVLGFTKKRTETASRLPPPLAQAGEGRLLGACRDGRQFRRRPSLWE